MESTSFLNGEKKWSTSGALAGMFTVMAKQEIKDPRTGKTREGVTALICTPEMERRRCIREKSKQDRNSRYMAGAYSIL